MNKDSCYIELTSQSTLFFLALPHKPVERERDQIVKINTSTCTTDEVISERAFQFGSPKGFAN